MNYDAPTMVGDGASDDGSRPLMMEVRPRIKSPPPDDLDLSQLRREPPHNASFVSKGFTAIGDKINILNDALGELQSLGIQHVANLPEVVLVGDQSAGKSSLMSAFSGIYLPRGDGACTRCPVHIRLSRSDTWSCKLSLQLDYQYIQRIDGGLNAAPSVTKDHPFGPWEEQHRVVKDFVTFHDNHPEKVEEALRWAQVAILNPYEDSDHYRPNIGNLAKRMSLEAAERSAQAFFSPNTVAMEISGPGSPDLSFYDLPGVIKNAKQDGEGYLVDVVENLATTYIRHKQAIILWAVPMNSDPDNSSTLNIIRRENAQDRTVGVMTKADLLPPGSQHQWLSVLRGEQHRVGHGFYITSRPQDVDMASASADGGDFLARQGASEEAYFNRTQPGGRGVDWPPVFGHYEDKCGVSRLTVFVSQELGKKFVESLPRIREKVEARLLDVNGDLEMLPDLPANPEVDIRSSLQRFNFQAKDLLEGLDLHNCLTGKAKGPFRTKIMDLKPKYVVNQDLSAPRAAGSSPRLAVATPNGPRGRTRNFDQFREDQPPPLRTPKRPRAGNGMKGEPDEDRTPARLLFPHPRRLDGGRPVGSPRRARTLAEVRQIIATKSNLGMPGLVSEAVHKVLCKQSIETWGTPVTEFVRQVSGILHEKLSQILRDSFHGLHGCRVYEKGQELIRQFVTDHTDRLRKTLDHLYQVEARGPFTLDEDTQTRHQAREMKILLHARHHWRWNGHLNIPENEFPALRTWDSLGLEDRAQAETKMASELAKLGPDSYEEELKVCAYVRGYYLTAAARFIDHVAMYLLWGIVPEMSDEIKNLYLDRQLGLLGSSGKRAAPHHVLIAYRLPREYLTDGSLY